MRESRLITLLQLQKPEGLQALISTYQAYVGTIIRNITRSSLSEQDRKSTRLNYSHAT